MGGAHLILVLCPPPHPRHSYYLGFPSRDSGARHTVSSCKVQPVATEHGQESKLRERQNLLECGVWRCTPESPELRRLRQEDQEESKANKTHKPERDDNRHSGSQACVRDMILPQRAAVTAHEFGMEPFKDHLFKV